MLPLLLVQPHAGAGMSMTAADKLALLQDVHDTLLGNYHIKVAFRNRLERRFGAGDRADIGRHLKRYAPSGAVRTTGTYNAIDWAT